MAVLAANRALEHGRQAHILGAGGVKELEILVGRGLLLLEMNAGMPVVLARDGDGMAGTVDALDGILRGKRGIDRECFQGGGVLFAAERIDDFNQAAIVLGDGGVAERHLLIAVSRHGENAQLEKMAIHVFEQAGVLGAAHDIGVNGAGLVRLDQFATDFFAVDPHGELVNAGPLGDGENIGSFQRPIRGVTESLDHARDGHLVLDGDVDFVADHGQRRQALVGGNQKPLGRRRACKCQGHDQNRQKPSHERILSKGIWEWPGKVGRSGSDMAMRGEIRGKGSKCKGKIPCYSCAAPCIFRLRLSVVVPASLR